MSSYFRNLDGASKVSQKTSIIESAARLKKLDVENKVPISKDFYPNISELSLEQAMNFLPESASTGQCIVHAVRPRAVITLLQISLQNKTTNFHDHKLML